ncbi:grasp-with-spasm system SPASM domain peptide maturase [Aquimarina celericrescens]|uniref:Grasp-with-spasm system SPASM domain peptide maturase n=1 Tax=Aquimarina celericrescens TaxID=1964542 RepID=A0ABW5ASZ3_9FLAO|nr:grasp-with-spasm system SPASM domain peptide maturase [Aquimarina celericrescens]
MIPKKVFKLYACCIPVKGHRRAVIVDSQRNDLFYIPLGMYDLLENHTHKTKEEIIVEFGHHKDIIEEYFEFLEKNELGFWTDQPEKFPKIEMQWDYPAQITNAIIDVDSNSSYDFDKAITQLDALGCGDILIRHYSPITLDDLIERFKIFEGTRIECIDLMIPNINLDIEAACLFAKKNIRIRSLMLTSSDKDKHLQRTRDDMGNVYLTKNIVDNAVYKDTTKITPDSFVFNVKMISESMHHNNYLNRKVTIDKDGFIKNTPSFKNHFGNINDIDLNSVINNPKFQKYWSVTKDQVEVCKDCEFRYNCLSYVENESEIYSAPKRCNYNPYESQWKSKPETLIANN